MQTFTLARVVVVLAFPILSLGAQINDPGSGTLRDRDALGLWIGVAHSSVSAPLGNATGMDLALAAVRWTHSMLQSSDYSIDYVFDLVPVAFVSIPLSSDSSSSGIGCQAGNPCALRALFTDQRAVFGAGAMPLGFQFRFAPHGRLQPFASASGGLLWFTDRVPDRESARLNFAAELGVGIVAMLGSRAGLLCGYRFHHLSNGGTAPSNPGVDSNLLYVGVTSMIRRD